MNHENKVLSDTMLEMMKKRRIQDRDNCDGECDTCDNDCGDTCQISDCDGECDTCDRNN